MPPKGSQLLNRVLSRENDDDRCSTSGSEKDMDLGLTHLAATASAGLRMEMEMLRESRSREKADGVDRDACIVDRQQFFNTQIGVGYQHKNVIRQRTVDSSHVGHQVVDMSVASSSLPSKGGQRRRLDKDGKEDDRCGDLDGARKSKRKKSNKSNSKTKSKKRKKEKDQYSGKINKKASKDAREKKSNHRRKTSSRHRDHHSKIDEVKVKVKVKSTQERKRKKKRKRDDAKEERDGSKVTMQVHDKSDGTSSSSSATSSNSAEESDDSLDMPTVSNVAPVTPPESGENGETDCTEGIKERVRLPLQRLRDLIEEKIQEKTRAKARDGNQREVLP